MRETLHFDNARHVQALFGNDEKNPAALRERLGVELTARDGWIQIEGADDAVGRAKEFVGTLDAMLRGGQSIRSREFAKALDVMAEEGVEALRALMSERVLTSPRKSAITPKTTGQRRYLEAIRTHDITLGIGPAGTGKTYLAMAMAVAALREEKVARIILTRPAVEAGEALGFLPGDLQEKLSPYLRPLHDALMDMMPAEEVQKLMERGTIEIAPLAYMRGRTLNHAFIVLDEAQNTTTEQMFMFLTRLGNGSRAVVTGDPSQVDLPRHKSSGIIEARQALAGVAGIALIEFSKRDVVRHPLVQRIINAYEIHRGDAPR
jgi:phosphate starvation-inducible protein PhoH and related proteins